MGQLFCVYNIMVLLNGSKNARHQTSIINRQNTCGGVKKAGTAPTVGLFLPSNPALLRVNKRMPLVCMPDLRTAPTQRVGYRATLGPN